jgi:hypothetical protein
LSDAIAYGKEIIQDPDVIFEAQARLTHLANLAASCGDLSQRDFCGHIERIGLGLILKG